MLHLTTILVNHVLIYIADKLDTLDSYTNISNNNVLES